MDLQTEIAARINELPADSQLKVLRFVTSLAPDRVKGVGGASLRELAGLIDDESARDMIQAIEEGCERIDYSEW